MPESAVNNLKFVIHTMQMDMEAAKNIPEISQASFSESKSEQETPIIKDTPTQTVKSSDVKAVPSVSLEKKSEIKTEAFQKIGAMPPPPPSVLQKSISSAPSFVPEKKQDSQVPVSPIIGAGEKSDSASLQAIETPAKSQATVFSQTQNVPQGVSKNIPPPSIIPLAVSSEKKELVSEEKKSHSENISEFHLKPPPPQKISLPFEMSRPVSIPRQDSPLKQDSLPKTISLSKPITDISSKPSQPSGGMVLDQKPVLEQKPFSQGQPLKSSPPIFSAQTKTKSGIELRPVIPQSPKIEPIITKPTYTPSGPPLRTVSTLNRELPDTLVKPKRVFKIKYVAVPLVLVALGAGIYWFNIIDMVLSLFEKGSSVTVNNTTGTQKPPVVAPPSASNEQSPASSLVSVKGVSYIDIVPGQENTITDFLRQALEKNYEVGALYQSNVRFADTKQILTVSEFLRLLRISPPFGFVDSVDPDFMFVVEGGLLKNSFGLILKAKSIPQDPEFIRLANQLASWEQKMVSDLSPLFSSQSQSLSAQQFQTLTIEGQKVRSARFSGSISDGVYYTVLSSKGVLLIGTSLDSITVLINESLTSNLQ